EFVAKSTTFEAADGERVIGFAIDPTSPQHAALLASQTYFGTVTMQGTQYFGAFQPIGNLKGELLGAFFVGSDASMAAASANEAVPGMAMMGLVLLVALGAISLVVTRLLMRLIPRIASAMEAIAGGDFATEVPFVTRGNELG